MKKALSIIVSLCMLLSLLSIGSLVSSAEENKLIDSGDEWAYFTAFDEETLPENWYSVGFDTADWTKGASPFTGDSYPNPNANTQIPQQGRNMKVAYVKTFQISDLSAIEVLNMQLYYDQDPVIYLNGEEIMTVSGYNNSLSHFNMIEYVDKLVEGTNTIAVLMQNPSDGYGYHFDMVLSAGIPASINEDGTIAIKNVEKSGFMNFGGANASENILDNNVDSCSGSARDTGTEQYFVLHFWEELDVVQIYLQCKGTEDGVTTSHEDGVTFGYYNVYVDEELVAEEAKAISKSDGGYTITLDTPVKGSSVKVEFTGEWYSTNWANLADIMIWNNLDNIVIEPEGIELNKTNVTLKVGETDTLTVTVNPEGATVSGLVWTSYDEGIVTVDDEGKLTAVAAGETQVLVETPEGFSSICFITVEEASQGGDNEGGDNEGGDNEGGDNEGSEIVGGDNEGSENVGGTTDGGDSEGNNNDTDNTDKNEQSTEEDGGITVYIIIGVVAVVIIAAIIVVLTKKKK